MMYKLGILCLIAMLSIGCASNKPKYVTKIETVTIYKPIYTPPESIENLKSIERPDIRSNHITEEDKQNPGKVIKIIIESQAQLRNYAEQLETQNETLIGIYKRPADEVPETTRTIETINSK